MPGLSHLLAALTLCLCISATAQTSRINGKVISTENNQPLPGVSVSIKGTTRGSTTNRSGDFSVVANSEAILVFSYTGFETTELPARGIIDSVTILLSPNPGDMNSVVVIGYGTQKKKEQTAAISTISGKDIVKSPVSNVTNSLVGRVPGLFAQQRSGRAGMSASDIAIRGRASTNSAALIIVDGVERQTFGDIDPNEIESISVLKDASSTALFGIKGANGVIIVTTKVGKTGKPKVSYSGNVGRVNFTQVPQFLSGDEAAMLHNEGENNLIKNGLAPSTYQKLFTDADIEIYKNGTGDPLLYPSVNWFEAITKPNWLRTQHNLNFTGGSRAIKYFVSLGYLYEDGGFKNFSTPSGYKTNPSYM